MRAGRGFASGAALVLGCVALLGCGSQPAAARAVAELDARAVLWPAKLGWVSSERPSGALPSAIALGGKASGRVLMYFEFATPSEPRRLLRAELVLVASGAPGESIEVELSRAEPARGPLAAWSDQPRARYPRVSARLASADLPERLDVTELMREGREPGEPLRLLLRAEPRASEPLLVETGADGGAAPRLEAYWE